jgi:peptide subunit release factor 1 (eRF1)
MTDGFRWEWSQHLKNEASAVEARLGDDPRARARFLRDLEVIRHTLAQPVVRQTRGMALFSAAEQDFFRAFSLPMPVRDQLVLDEAPYLVPLLEAIHRQRRYLLVLTDSHHGELYELAWGHSRLIQKIEHPVPRRQRSAGETWGKQQATIARHREDHVLHYCKALVGGIERAWTGAPFRGLILMGDHETVEAVRSLLNATLASQVVHTGPYAWATGTPDIETTVRQVLDEALREHDARLQAEVARRLQEHYLIAAGPQEVVNALRNGQVGYPGYLVLEPDRGQRAARCTRCESLFTTMYATCPVCQGTCEQVSLWQEILLFAARHDIMAHIVDTDPVLARHGGVAAVLSRAEPWEPARTETKTGTAR